MLQYYKESQSYDDGSTTTVDLCINPDDESILYATDVNGYIYSIDISNDTICV